MKTKKQIANSTADDLMLIKKAKEGDIIVLDERKERMGMSSMGINLKDVWDSFELKKVCEKLGLHPNKQGELVK